MWLYCFCFLGPQRSWSDRLWPGNELIYAIGDGFDDSAVDAILDSMAVIADRTCVSFREKGSTDTGYVFIDNKFGPGCLANVGYFEGQVRQLNLDIGCKV